MTENASFSRCLTDVTAAVQRGDISRAKRYAGHLLDQLDEHTSGVVAACVDTIERYPERADIHLRARWKSATSTSDRTVIAAFGTAFVQRAPRPAHAPTSKRPKSDTAPRDQRTETRPEVCRILTEQDRARLRAEDRADAIATAYADRAGVDDEPPSSTVYASGLDYDRAAIHALRGTPCVRCWLERIPTDYRSRSDDGLCDDCRQKGRTGIPHLPADHTRADAVEARCAFLTETYGNARALLARWWKAYATPADRLVITEWVHRHSFTGEPADPAPRTATNTVLTTNADSAADTDTDITERCTRCAYPRADDAPDTLCDECREVDRMTVEA